MAHKFVPEYNEAWNERIHRILELGEELEGVVKDSLKSLGTTPDFRQCYVIGLALQCLSHFRAGGALIRSGIDEEVWILIRCVAEHIIKIKWCYLRKTNAEWLVIGSERKDANLLERKRRRSRLEKQALQAITNRIDRLKIRKNAVYWDKAKGKVRAICATETMAKKAGLTRFYEAYFRAGSNRTHGHHRQLGRFIQADDQGRRGFVVNPIDPRDFWDATYSLVAILDHLISVLQKCGWPCDQARKWAAVRRLVVLMPPCN